MTEAALDTGGIPRQRVLHRWVWAGGTPDTERCARRGCACQRRVRGDGGRMNEYRVSPAAPWSTAVPACTGARGA